MRRFLIWSALSLVLGLLIAGGGYWAYWNFYARYEPQVIERNQAEIQRLLDESSWVSGGGGGEPLYLVTYRDSGASMAYQQSEFEKLRAAGVEPRVIVFARPDKEGLSRSTAAERATVAEIWWSRDWSLYERWMATPAKNWTAAGLPPADGNMARTSVVEGGRNFVQRLEELLRGAGAKTGNYPLILWRDQEGRLKVCACAYEKSWPFIRDDFGAPDRVEAPAAPATMDPAAPEKAPSAPYPSVEGSNTPAAPLPSAIPASPSPIDPAPRAEPAQPRTPRPAPTPSKQDDTTFY